MQSLLKPQLAFTGVSGRCRWIGSIATITLACVALTPVMAIAGRGSCTLFVRNGFTPAPGVSVDGRTPRSALSRIRDAAQLLSNAGEVICVGPGVYVERDITPRRSGIATHPIVFRADPTGESTQDAAGPVRLIAPPASADSPAAGFRLLGQSHIVIEGFELEGYQDPAIQVRSAVNVAGNSTDVTIRGNRVRNIERTGIDVSAEGVVVVEGNHIVAAGGSGISIRSCVNAAPVGAPSVPADPRCRGGPSLPVNPIIDGNRTGIHIGHGIFVQDAAGAVIQNNVVYSNDLTGITLRNAPDTLVVNNLVYRSGEQGVAIGTADLPSPRAVLVNNTVYDNLKWGILIGSGNVASEGAMVVNNILLLNGRGEQGIGVQNESGLAVRSTCGYVAGFNVTGDDYGPRTPVNIFDVRSDPLFAGPISGPDGIIGGHRDGTLIVDGSADDNFTLRQPGSSRVSPAVDTGYASVAAVGLLGSTSPNGAPDVGFLDAGYHYGVPPGNIPVIPTPFMPVYVRLGGSNSNSGRTPEAPFASIAAGALRARAGVTVIVGPGVYRECRLRPTPDQGRAIFVGDADGQFTGDSPGPVLIDVGCCSIHPVGLHCVPGGDGFNIPNACNVIVDGFHVRGAIDSGIIIQAGSHGAQVRNNVTFTNDRRGIGVIDAHDVQIFNNLVYDNLGGGIQVGGGNCSSGTDCSDLGSRRAIIENNTCYANGVNGILIGSGAGHSTYATVRYNIMHVGIGESLPPGQNGIQVGSNTTLQNHIEGYSAYFNVNFEGRYGGSTPQPPSDRIDDPLFVNPAGPDGILGGVGYADDRFQLEQRSSGQTRDSPAVDFSDVTAAEQGLDSRTTRTDLVVDDGLVDIGYHYPLYRSRVIGDCDGDGFVTVSELIKAVSIALGRISVDQCANADANGDGTISISELTLSVRSALYGLR